MLYAIPAPPPKIIPQENRDDWVHPKIQRFLNRLRDFDHMPPFQVNWSKYALVGWSVPHLPRIDAAQQIIGNVGFWTNFSIKNIALALFGSALQVGVLGALESLRPSVKWFEIDYRYKPALWDSNDEQYWQDVLDFFHCR